MSYGKPIKTVMYHCPWCQWSNHRERTVQRHMDLDFCRKPVVYQRHSSDEIVAELKREITDE